MKKEENRKTACEAKQEENFSLCGNSGNKSLSAENAGEEKSNAGEKKRDADGIKGDTSEKKRKNGYFSRGEAILWIVSVCVITVAFAFSPEKNYLSLVASLIGVTSLIFIAKGNPIGQALTIVFSVLYGIISYTFAYCGEMIIYLAMTAPMAVLALAEWLKNPYEGRKNEVKIRKLPLREYFFAALLAAAVTVIFYFVLRYFRTANLAWSTVSVTTSFLAVYFTFRRSPHYALAYAANDVVLIVLWSLATAENPAYLSVVVCFFAFLANDIYGFCNWKKMLAAQSREAGRKDVSAETEKNNRLRHNFGKKSAGKGGVLKKS